MFNINWDDMITAEEKIKKAKEVAASVVKAEATHRIELRWSKAGQNNIALGLYTESERQDCINWINAHRAACQAIIERPDLLDLDITDKSLWPSTD